MGDGQTPIDIALDALHDIRRAIFNADPKVLTDTLWMPEDTYMGGTVVDFIENAMERVRARPSQAGAGGGVVRPTGHVKIEHDGFTGDIIGYYTTREGKHGVVVQQERTRVVHVYGEKWIPASSRCAICGGEHDNDLGSDICQRCEQTAPWREVTPTAPPVPTASVEAVDDWRDDPTAAPAALPASCITRTARASVGRTGRKPSARN